MYIQPEITINNILIITFNFWRGIYSKLILLIVISGKYI